MKQSGLQVTTDHVDLRASVFFDSKLEGPSVGITLLLEICAISIKPSTPARTNTRTSLRNGDESEFGSSTDFSLF